MIRVLVGIEVSITVEPAPPIEGGCAGIWNVKGVQPGVITSETAE
jgi:hypothetical protein